MAFDFSTLVTDRTQADVAYAKALLNKLVDGTATEAERAEWNSFTLKGVYNHTDLNRVTAAMDALRAKLVRYGYAVPGYQRIKVPHVVPEPEPTSRLPEGYTELTYIESTGTQYIDTGFKPNQDTRVVVDAQLTTVAGSQFFFGTRTASYTTNFSFLADTATALRSDYGEAKGTTSAVSLSARATIDKNKNVCKVNSATITSTASTFQCGLSLFLFSCNEGGTAKYFGKAKLYSCQIYDNGTLIRDYVPCINSNGEVGLYDLVTATFFNNSGTGSFVAGVVSSKLPDGYAQVEYIQSSGLEYIDTRFAPNANTKTVISAVVPALPSENAWFFGSRENSLDGRYSVYILEGGQFGFGINTGTTTLSAAQASTRYEISLDGNVCTINGTSTTASVSMSSNTRSIYLFAENRAGSAQQGLAYQLYSCQIYNNGTLVRDFVPCINPSGVVGLYDMVNDVFYQNAGSGVFTTGKEIAPPADAPSVDTPIVDEYDPYLWYEFDWPTPQTMTTYLLNVSAIRAVLDVMESTPQVPDDMVGLMVTEANDIEVILIDVYRQINIMLTTFIPCGEALCGGDNL